MDDQIEKNKNSIEDILADIESLKEEVENVISEMAELESPADAGESTTQVNFGGEARTTLHWVDPSSEGIDCTTVTSLETARDAFSTVAAARDAATDKPDVQHGDFMVLLCEPQPDPNADPNDPLPTPCYYIGFCVEDNGSNQLPPANTAEFSQLTGSDYYRNKYFIAWSSCGGGDTEGHTGQVILNTIPADGLGTTVTKTESSPDANGCRDITIQIQTERIGLNFVDGLLTGDPAITSESTNIETFTFKAGCGDPCPSDNYSDSYTVSVSGHPTSSANGSVTISRPTNGDCESWSGSNGNAVNPNDPLSGVRLIISGLNYTLALQSGSGRGHATSIETAAIAVNSITHRVNIGGFWNITISPQ